MRYELIEVTAKFDWQEYHSVRRRALWERRGLTNYDATHADEHKIANHPLLLRLDGRAIGTVRLHDFGNGTGAVRLPMQEAYGELEEDMRKALKDHRSNRSVLSTIRPEGGQRRREMDISTVS